MRKLALALAVLVVSAIPAFAQCGIASHYGIGDGFHGRKTASGERFNAHGYTAAHRTLAFGTVLHVTNPRTGRSVSVRINDRGPFIRGRILDLSSGAARSIGLGGTGKVCF